MQPALLMVQGQPGEAGQHPASVKEGGGTGGLGWLLLHYDQPLHFHQEGGRARKI